MFWHGAPWSKLFFCYYEIIMKLILDKIEGHSLAKLYIDSGQKYYKAI